MAAEASSYKLKAIRFFGREVPVVLQNDNGPCPLLAIANILLLRNQIQLPIGLSDVSQVCIWQEHCRRLESERCECASWPVVACDCMASSVPDARLVWTRE